MRGNSLQVRFTFIVVLLTTCVVGAFGYLNYASAKAERMAEVNARIDRLGLSLASSLSNPLWEYNFPAVREIADSATKESFLRGIAVKSNVRLVYGVQSDGQLIQDGEAPPKSDEIKTTDIVFQTSTSRESVGSLILYLSFEDVNDRLRKDLLWMLLQLGALNVTLVVGIAWALKRVVIQPIDELGTALSNVASGTADLTLRLSTSGTAELDNVTVSFNAFVQKLQEVMGAPSTACTRPSQRWRVAIWVRTLRMRSLKNKASWAVWR